ncbi:MAG TPA: pyridoxal-phosphate dependent enzyme [Polyangiaceae bacterium]|nr:pyridoxal-phosphate dependent enzyme [Polyangiaceae bacterium]
MRKLRLAHLPTPLTHSAALDRLVGTEVWVKRDDMTSGAAAGNKIRKLEYLLADALERGATRIITCGAVQSNHARATAISAAELGLRSLLFLRNTESTVPPPSANLLLDQLVGAEIRLISPADYRRRGELMAAAAAELATRGDTPYVIPEGGSNGLGAFGYVAAMAEIEAQLAAAEGGGPAPYDAVIHACGSGGTAAGVALGLARHPVAQRAIAVAVCDDRAYFEQAIGRIVAEAVALDPSLDPSARAVIYDQWKGPAYGVASDEQLDFITEVAAKTGLLFDPVYTGKALFGLSRLEPKPARVLFLHTGGLPGLLAENETLARALERRGLTRA